MKFSEDMESQTNSNKRKRLEEEPEDEKQEKRQRLEDTTEQFDEVLKNKSAVLSNAETHKVDNNDDRKLNQTEQDAPRRCISVTESKKEKENAVFINMPAKVDDCRLPIIERENEEGAIKMTLSARSLDSRDDNNDGDVRNSDARCSSTTISESKNTDESKGKDIQIEKEDLGIELGIEKGGNINSVTHDAVQENEDKLDNCVEEQIGNNLEEKGITNEIDISPEVLKESHVQIEKGDESDANLAENECNDSDSTPESGNQTVTSEKSGEHNEIDEGRFLYRLLRPNEDYDHGLRPKNFNSNTSIDDHVANGSCDFVESKYISCSKTRDGINKFASIIRKKQRSQLRYIIRIDKFKLDDDCKIYDLTEESVRTEHLHSERAKRHSLPFDEVLLSPSREIPVGCFTKVANVKDGAKIWNNDAL